MELQPEHEFWMAIVKIKRKATKRDPAGLATVIYRDGNSMAGQVSIQDAEAIAERRARRWFKTMRDTYGPEATVSITTGKGWWSVSVAI